MTETLASLTTKTIRDEVANRYSPAAQAVMEECTDAQITGAFQAVSDDFWEVYDHTVNSVITILLTRAGVSTERKKSK